MSVCGDFGGVTAKGEPCQRTMEDGLCPSHRASTDLTPKKSGFRIDPGYVAVILERLSGMGLAPALATEATQEAA